MFTREQSLQAEKHFEMLRKDINDRLNNGYKPSPMIMEFLNGWGKVQAHFHKFIHSGKEEFVL